MQACFELKSHSPSCPKSTVVSRPQKKCLPVNGSSFLYATLLIGCILVVGRTNVEPHVM